MPPAAAGASGDGGVLSWVWRPQAVVLLLSVFWGRGLVKVTALGFLALAEVHSVQFTDFIIGQY